jgi:hypothetical protein
VPAQVPEMLRLHVEQQFEAALLILIISVLDRVARFENPVLV